jgi:N-acetylneuraminic acid mutarotase
MFNLALNQVDCMPKDVFIYEDKKGTWKVLESKVQLVELTGLSIRSIHRKLDKGAFSGYNKDVFYSVYQAVFYRDRRKNNCNKNIN